MKPLRSVPSPAPTSAPLWRDELGAHLREKRLQRGERLRDIAERAGISVQYLSEIERGTKDPSSEMIAAVAGALDTGLAEVTEAVSRRLRGVPAAIRRTGTGYDALALAA